jgi:hypothetical protein
MILRHLAEKLKAQNWTAIAIEFVLLVLVSCPRDICACCRTAIAPI